MSSTISPLHLSSTLSAPEAGKPRDAADAAKQFEALMIGQMLRSTREESSDEQDSTGSTMLDLADQQFAKMLADRGGLGLATMIAKSLKVERPVLPAASLHPRTSVSVPDASLKAGAARQIARHI
jgi:flagellar protein FlgJ